MEPSLFREWFHFLFSESLQMHIFRIILTIIALVSTVNSYADTKERSQRAERAGKNLTVKEWKTTPDGKKSWVDHIEVYNHKGQLISESEYSDYGRNLAWRAEYEYNAAGQLVREVVYNERNKISKVRKYEYDSKGACTRRLNYNANGTLNSYRKFEYIYE